MQADLEHLSAVVWLDDLWFFCILWEHRNSIDLAFDFVQLGADVLA